MATQGEQKSATQIHAITNRNHEARVQERIWRMMDDDLMKARLMIDEQALAPEVERWDVLRNFNASRASKTSTSIYNSASGGARYRITGDSKVTCDHQVDGFYVQQAAITGGPASCKQRNQGALETNRSTYQSSTMPSE
ncbi:hypothetical protein RRF57_004004 [Xylaria bambusicola]|uniref:Uncharacterized protein n=1 Tax=Xylaria bambusicola TaxID=326684 RepID=A0AAN7UFY6_9PEZI